MLKVVMAFRVVGILMFDSIMKKDLQFKIDSVSVLLYNTE